MEENDKDWMMIRMVGGGVFLLVPAHPGSPGQRTIKTVVVVQHPFNGQDNLGKTARER